MKLIERTPKDSGLYRQLYVALEASGNPDAVGTFARLVRSYPTIEAPYWYLLAALEHKGDHVGLVDTIFNATKIFSGDDRWLRHLLAVRERHPGTEIINEGILKIEAQHPGLASQCVGQGGPETLDPQGASKRDGEPDSTSANRFEAHEATMRARLKTLTDQERDDRKRAGSGAVTPNKALSPEDKFRSIKPTGSRDGYG